MFWSIFCAGVLSLIFSLGHFSPPYKVRHPSSSSISSILLNDKGIRADGVNGTGQKVVRLDILDYLATFLTARWEKWKITNLTGMSLLLKVLTKRSTERSIWPFRRNRRQDKRPSERRRPSDYPLEIWKKEHSTCPNRTTRRNRRLIQNDKACRFCQKGEETPHHLSVGYIHRRVRSVPDWCRGDGYLDPFMWDLELDAFYRHNQK